MQVQEEAKCKKAKAKKRRRKESAKKRCKTKKKRCKKAKGHLYVFAGSAGSSVKGEVLAAVRR